jgi:tetrahydromethanopterin S-methyltransferase subunit G
MVPHGQTIVAEEDLRRLHDRLYRLESAVQDVDADLGERTGARAYREALDHLLEAARDLVGLVVEPVRQ